jgi:hypothetical protein
VSVLLRQAGGFEGRGPVLMVVDVDNFVWCNLTSQMMFVSSTSKGRS